MSEVDLLIARERKQYVQRPFETIEIDDQGYACIFLRLATRNAVVKGRDRIFALPVAGRRCFGVSLIM